MLINSSSSSSSKPYRRKPSSSSSSSSSSILQLTDFDQLWFSYCTAIDAYLQWTIKNYDYSSSSVPYTVPSTTTTRKATTEQRLSSSLSTDNNTVNVFSSSSSYTSLSTDGKNNGDILKNNLKLSLSLLLQYIPLHPLGNYTYRQALLHYIDEEEEEEEEEEEDDKEVEEESTDNNEHSSPISSSSPPKNTEKIMTTVTITPNHTTTTNTTVIRPPNLRLPFLLPIILNGLSPSSAPLILQCILKKYLDDILLSISFTNPNKNFVSEVVASSSDLIDPLRHYPFFDDKIPFEDNSNRDGIDTIINLTESLPLWSSGNRSSSSSSSRFLVFIVLWLKISSMDKDNNHNNTNYIQSFSHSLFTALRLLVRKDSSLFASLGCEHVSSLFAPSNIISSQRTTIKSNNTTNTKKTNKLSLETKPNTNEDDDKTVGSPTAGGLLFPWIILFACLVPLCLSSVREVPPESNSTITMRINEPLLVTKSSVHVKPTDRSTGYFQDMLNVLYESSFITHSKVVRISSSHEDNNNVRFSPTRTISSVDMFIDRLAIVVAGCTLFLESVEDLFNIAKFLHSSSVLIHTSKLFPSVSEKEREILGYVVKVGGDTLEQLSDSLACSEDYLPSVRTRLIRQIASQNGSVNTFLVSINHYLNTLDISSDSKNYFPLKRKKNESSTNNPIVSMVYAQLTKYQQRSKIFMGNLFLNNDNSNDNTIILQSSTNTGSILTSVPKRGQETRSYGDEAKNINKIRKTDNKGMKSKKQICSIRSMELPSDVLRSIFEYIDNPLTLGTVSRVSQAWCEISRSSNLWLPHYSARWTIINNYGSPRSSSPLVPSTSASVTRNVSILSVNSTLASSLAKLITLPIPLKLTYLRCLCNTHSYPEEKSTRLCPNHNYYVMFRTRLLAEKKAIYLSHQSYLHQSQKVQLALHQRKTKRITDKLIHQLNHHLDRKAAILPRNTNHSFLSSPISNLPLSNASVTNPLLSAGSDTLELTILPRWTYRVCDVCTCSKVLESVEQSKQHLKLHHGLSK